MSAAAPAGRSRFDLVDTLLSIWGVLVYVFLFLPIAVIVWYSFNSGRALLAWESFGFDGYESMLNNTIIHRSVFTSLQAAIGAAIISTVLGTCAALALARRPGRWTIGFLAILFLVMVTPEIVDGISLLIWYVWLGGPFGNGFVRLWIGHSLFATAVVTLIVRARLAGLDESLEEAAADLYATPWKRFQQITLPLAMPAILAGLLLAFSLSLDNTIISNFVSVAGTTPWPAYVFGSIRNVQRPEIASTSTVLLLLTLTALAVVGIVLKRGGESTEDVAKTIAGV
jgi:ABC-type spermidine/putrescine transport system permease subunit II